MSSRYLKFFMHILVTYIGVPKKKKINARYSWHWCKFICTLPASFVFLSWDILVPIMRMYNMQNKGKRFEKEKIPKYQQNYLYRTCLMVLTTLCEIRTRSLYHLTLEIYTECSTSRPFYGFITMCILELIPATHSDF